VGERAQGEERDSVAHRRANEEKPTIRKEPS
jgi:hypothetical protein